MKSCSEKTKKKRKEQAINNAQAPISEGRRKGGNRPTDFEQGYLISGGVGAVAENRADRLKIRFVRCSVLFDPSHRRRCLIRGMSGKFNRRATEEGRPT